MFACTFFSSLCNSFHIPPYLYNVERNKPETMTYAEFKKIAPRVEFLRAKQKANTITAAENKELYALMFGEEFMESEDKGARKTYAE